MLMTKKNNIMINSLFFSAYKLFNIFFPLVTSVYVARVLQAEGIGKVAYAQNIASYFILIASLGLPIYGTKEIARCISKKSECNTIFFELLLINFIFTSICATIYYSLCFLIPKFHADFKLYFISGISILLNYFNIDWLYQGREEFKYIAIRGFIVKLFSTLLLFLLVKEQSDYIIYAGMQCIIIGGNNFINFLGLNKRISFNSKKLKPIRHLKSLIVMFATNVAIEIYTMLDTTMIGTLCEMTVVGYYSYSMKITKIVITVLIASITVLLPRFSKSFNEGDKILFNTLGNRAIIFLLFSSIPLSTVLFINADHVILFLYGEEYIPAIITLKILSIIIVPISFSTFFGVHILCSTGMELDMLKAVSIGAITNIILNILLISRYKQNGAAVASLISEIIVALVEFYFIKKIININIDKKEVVIIFLSEILLIITVILIRLLLRACTISLFVSSIIGMGVYLAIIFLFNYNEIRQIINK